MLHNMDGSMHNIIDFFSVIHAEVNVWMICEIGSVM